MKCILHDNTHFTEWKSAFSLRFQSIALIVYAPNVKFLFVSLDNDVYSSVYILIHSKTLELLLNLIG